MLATDVQFAIRENFLNLAREHGLALEIPSILPGAVREDLNEVERVTAVCTNAISWRSQHGSIKNVGTMCTCSERRHGTQRAAL
jgi:hypothetical protein